MPQTKDVHATVELWLASAHARSRKASAFDVRATLKVTHIRASGLQVHSKLLRFEVLRELHTHGLLTRTTRLVPGGWGGRTRNSYFLRF